MRMDDGFQPMFQGWGGETLLEVCDGRKERKKGGKDAPLRDILEMRQQQM